MRRCPVAAWEGWTTKRDIHEDSERAAEGNRRRPNLKQPPSVAIEAHFLQRVEIRLLGEFPGLSRNGRATATRESP